LDALVVIKGIVRELTPALLADLTSNQLPQRVSALSKGW